MLPLLEPKWKDSETTSQLLYYVFISGVTTLGLNDHKGFFIMNQSSKTSFDDDVYTSLWCRGVVDMYHFVLKCYDPFHCQDSLTGQRRCCVVSILIKNCYCRLLSLLSSILTLKFQHFNQYYWERQENTSDTYLEIFFYRVQEFHFSSQLLKLHFQFGQHNLSIRTYKTNHWIQETQIHSYIQSCIVIIV